MHFTKLSYFPNKREHLAGKQTGIKTSGANRSPLIVPMLLSATLYVACENAFEDKKIASRDQSEPDLRSGAMQLLFRREGHYISRQRNAACRDLFIVRSRC
jgi:hypothetical protein